MPRGKNTPSKKTSTKPLAKPEEHAEEIPHEEADIFPSKEKVVLEIEEREDILPPMDKLVADPLLETHSIEGLDTDELGLDEEELDPFGDKWEA